MGTTIFYIAMVTHPELNAKIDIMISLAPVASLAHLSSPVKVLAPYSNSIQVRQFLHNSSKRRMCVIKFEIKEIFEVDENDCFS